MPIHNDGYCIAEVPTLVHISIVKPLHPTIRGTFTILRGLGTQTRHSHTSLGILVVKG
jgi:hypothetical protein